MDWFELSNIDAIDSPALVVENDRMKANIDKTVAMVGGQAQRLRPHVKTHKMKDVIQLQLDAGIKSYKAATLAEAEMVAKAGAADVLLAHQPVGPKVDRLLQLIDDCPEVLVSTIVDDPGVVKSIAVQAAKRKSIEPIHLFIDVECGMHRTGIALGAQFDALIQCIAETDQVHFAGLHVYDGHLHQPSLAERESSAGEIIDAVRSVTKQHPGIQVVGGGSPTFAIWARQADWQCSPGTPVLWDVGYASDYPDLDFQIAAALVTRVISKPSEDTICLDLGHKAVSSEMDLANRVVLPEIPDAKLIGHSEEHLVVFTSKASEIAVGDAFLAFPQHICPSVADHALAHIVQWSNATGEAWKVTARDR